MSSGIVLPATKKKKKKKKKDEEKKLEANKAWNFCTVLSNSFVFSFWHTVSKVRKVETKKGILFASLKKSAGEPFEGRVL